MVSRTPSEWSPVPRGAHQGHVLLDEVPELGRDEALAPARQLLVALSFDVPRVGEDDPRRQRDVDVGRPEIGLGLRVEVVRGSRRARVAVAHEDLRSPVDEVLGGGPRRGAAAPFHVPGVEHVSLFGLRPEHDVLRVEVVDQDLGHDGLVPEHLPADAVAGEETHQGVGLDRPPRNPLVPLRSRNAGPAIDEGDELAHLVQDHVVLRGAVDGD